MNPKLLKIAAKGFLMLSGSVLIGTIIKAEKKLDDRIDEYFFEPTDEEKND